MSQVAVATTAPHAMFWTDGCGKAHRVRIVERGVSTAIVEFWDNVHRGERWVAGRRYNHGTRVRKVVFLRDVRVR